MYLVHEKKFGHGKWEVGWTWLPYFLAADSQLIKEIDKAMTQEFRGEEMTQGPILQKMTDRVVELILKKYPIKGLPGYLKALALVEPEEKL